MRPAGTLGFMVTLFFMGPVVCAGVMRVLGDIVNGFGLEEQIVVWIFVGVVSVCAALLFLYGAMEWVNRQFNVRGAAK